MQPPVITRRPRSSIFAEISPHPSGKLRYSSIRHFGNQSSFWTSKMEGKGRRLPRVPCKQCKRKHMPWKGSNSRARPYEKVDNACDHQPTTFRTSCERCCARLQKDEAGRMSCLNPECQRFPKHAITPVPVSFQHNIPIPEQSKTNKSQAPLILRTHCRNCRLDDEVCSGLISGPRCERCKIKDLECDCKVLRRSCEECMKDREKTTWKRCAGIYDECDTCIEKGIECKEFVRVPGKPCVKKKSEDTVGHGTMDVIDGMKTARAFAACERCLTERLKCDESLPGCGSCREKDQQCMYKLLTTFAGELLYI
jgi:Fungal Zn(2)-Cys(6) binuclear cluster domain